MRNNLLLFLSSLLTLLPPTVSGSHCSYPASYSYQAAPYYVQPVYQTQVYQQFYPVAIPLYSLSYAVPAAQITAAQVTTYQASSTSSLLQTGQAAGATSLAGMQGQDQMERLIAAVERVAANGGGGGAMAAQQQLPAHALVLHRHCAQCHTGPNAEKGFKIFESQGQLAQMSPEQVGALIFRLSTQDQKLKMPPGPNKLSYQEYAQVMEGIVTQPAVNGNGQPQPQVQPKQAPPQPKADGL